MRRLHLVIAGVLLVTFPARAHDADVLYARLEPGPAGTLIEIVTLTNASLALLAPVDANDDGVLTQADLDARADALKAGVWSDMPLSVGGVACTRSDEAAQLEDGFVALTASWRCPEEGDLRQDFKVLRVLPTNYRVVLGSQLDGERGRRFAQGVFTALEVPRPKAPGLFDGDRLRRGLEQGVRDNGVVEALAALLLIFLTARGVRGGGLRVALLMLGACVVFSGSAALLAGPVTLSLGVLMLVFLPPGAGPGRLLVVAPVLVGIGLGLRSRLSAFGDGLGWLCGLLLLAVVLLAGGIPMGDILQRRARLFLVVKLVLVAVVLVSAGLRALRLE
ncbi:MAG: hypothetical protein Q8S33_21155 [Myxococcales bacterium]|nr:hypothetical protein [Myxococcales bacterium]MDP3502855.1 hypothetical protein [Myxococcales bacterium]